MLVIINDERLSNTYFRIICVVRKENFQKGKSQPQSAASPTLFWPHCSTTTRKCSQFECVGNRFYGIFIFRIMGKGRKIIRQHQTEITATHSHAHMHTNHTIHKYMRSHTVPWWCVYIWGRWWWYSLHCGLLIQNDTTHQERKRERERQKEGESSLSSII